MTESDIGLGTAILILAVFGIINTWGLVKLAKARTIIATLSLRRDNWRKRYEELERRVKALKEENYRLDNYTSSLDQRVKKSAAKAHNAKTALREVWEIVRHADIQP